MLTHQDGIEINGDKEHALKLLGKVVDNGGNLIHHIYRIHVTDYLVTCYLKNVNDIIAKSALTATWKNSSFRNIVFKQAF